ncbi:tetratricopeptide repeat protein [Carboxylicivirga mesophila]|uniref:Tetratricopeptide repeat protein n=1 Tax=Carboxylicivirga mesophila TaxID=1166478 RepID=A0ABS5K7T9_9BACT|nr:tetratricopeptide repeat protein [Carboxylicivirga mesophila]MBS2210947.1 tetratricopeptide repeat protein [Carboxylicivirga mesophila]
MSKEKHTHQDDSFENVESALSKTEHFIEENQNRISMIALAIIIIVAGYWGLKKFYFLPLEQEAQKQVFYAQQYFEQDSFKLALNGDGQNYGFIEIMDEYGSTKAGKLAAYYAGVSNLHLGNYNEAVNYLSGFSSSEEMVAATAAGALGDAYAELGENDKAISQYKTAASYDNSLTAPTYLMKLGVMYEAKGDYKAAVEAYQKIKDKYASSAEARQVDKYLTRAKLQTK